ncbi:MAG: Gfo/Idh/MocA family oxidoreductase [Planctomycetota bacterium]|nr:MAG: Gfo/Idh/MocA family oxidoreductase [Planctomycetota bacterium]
MAGSMAGRWASAQEAIRGANDKVNLGVIGCGRRGAELLNLTLGVDNTAIPIVCDVDSKRAGQAADQMAQMGYKKPVIVKDYLRILDNKDIDAVIIATPDHWHAIQHLRACLAGKDVYVETPISHNIAEGNMMRFATRKYRRVVQVGLQQRSDTRLGKSIKEGWPKKIGSIGQTRSWTFAKVKPIPRQPDAPSPGQLDYDLWLGPAPQRPYNPGRVNGNSCYWWDYGGGTIGKWNPHLMDTVNRIMKINTPKSVVAVGGNHGLKDFRETPDTMEAVLEYDSPFGPFVHVYSLRLGNGHAGWGPPIAAHNGQIEPDHSMHYGVQIHGDQATLFVDRNGSALFPADFQQPETISKLTEEASRLEYTLTLDHLKNFINCVRTRSEPKAPIEAGAYALLPCQLANISYRLERKIYYESRTQKCYLDPEHKELASAADSLFIRRYRKPYGIPAV